MAMQMGFLEKEQTKQKSSGLQELKAQRYSIEDKSRSVNLPLGFRIRIRIQEGKYDPQKEKKLKKFHVLKCWMFSFES
jgi:hypothetical protein